MADEKKYDLYQDGAKIATNTEEKKQDISGIDLGVPHTFKVDEMVDGVPTTSSILYTKQGEKGDTGAQGPEGPEGPRGPKGDKGDTGNTGKTGLQGEKGDTGPEGPPGKDGSGGGGTQGPKGDTGDSAYQIAVDKGFVGDEAAWLASLKGPKGDTGAKGEKGDTGAKGEKGDTGAQGIQGPKGDKGDTGAKGADGAGVDPTELNQIKTDIANLKKSETTLSFGSVVDGTPLNVPIGDHFALEFTYVDDDHYTMAIVGTNATATMANSASYLQQSGQSGIAFSFTSFYTINDAYRKDLFGAYPISYNESFANIIFQELDNNQAYAIDINAFKSATPPNQNSVVLEINKFSK